MMESKVFNEVPSLAPCLGDELNGTSLDEFLENCVDREWNATIEPAQVAPGSLPHIPALDPAELFSMNTLYQTPKIPDVTVSVQVTGLKDSYEKGQSRHKAKSQQRLLNGEVNFTATMSHPLQDIHVYVERVPEAARILQDTTGRVPLQIIWRRGDSNSVTFSVDLDSVYEKPDGGKVYELSRVKGEERNIFHLNLVFLFMNGVTREYTSKRFRVKSKTVSPKSESRDEFEDSTCSSEDQVSFSYDNSLPNRKRKRADLGDCEFSPGSISSGVGSEVSTSFSEVITDHLVAQTAIIDELQINKPMLTQRGDIAYHFPLEKSLKDENEEFEEGDVIGFFEDPDGKTYIQKLTHFNAKNVKLAGVISRSAYLEAKANLGNTEKDTDEVVCMIGMVKVKVMGAVKNGERIYASLESPGVAVPQSRVCDVTSQDSFLLGQSLETVECKSNDITSPHCFVSIILTISTGHVTRAVNDMRSGVKEDVKSEVKHVKKKCMIGLRRWLFAGFILAVLISVLLYQFFAPGTALRYFMCGQGAIEGSEMYFTFTTVDKQTPRVHGIQFKFAKLKKKLDLEFDEISIKGAKYYLNIDRCANGGIRPVASTLDGFPMVRGAEIVAVNHNCTRVYYHSDKWEPYDSGRDIVCTTDEEEYGE